MKRKTFERRRWRRKDEGGGGEFSNVEFFQRCSSIVCGRLFDYFISIAASSVGPLFILLKNVLTIITF